MKLLPAHLPTPPAAESFPKEVVRGGVQDDLHIKGKPNQRSTTGPVERIGIENRHRICFYLKKKTQKNGQFLVLFAKN